MSVNELFLPLELQSGFHLFSELVCEALDGTSCTGFLEFRLHSCFCNEICISVDGPTLRFAGYLAGCFCSMGRQFGSDCDFGISPDSLN
jgi:hypothetical protein